MDDCAPANVLLPTCQLLLNHAKVGERSELQQPDWFGSARVWEEPQKAGMKQGNLNAAAGMSLAWLGLSAEERSQQPPAGSRSWPHCWLNINVYKSLKQA